jgi:hypothetical protein
MGPASLGRVICIVFEFLYSVLLLNAILGLELLGRALSRAQVRVVQELPWLRLQVLRLPPPRARSEQHLHAVRARRA